MLTEWHPVRLGAAIRALRAHEMETADRIHQMTPREPGMVPCPMPVVVLGG